MAPAHQLISSLFGNLSSRTMYDPTMEEPVAGKVANVIVTVVASSLCFAFFWQRYSKVTNWCSVPYIQWLVLGLYADSFAFLLGSAVLQYSFNMNDSFAACQAGTILCLSAYITTKFIYLFLVDRAHIIRCNGKSRLKSKLYLFNSFGMLLVCFGLVVVLLIFRINELKGDVCIIGVKQAVLIGAVTYDVIVNIYLTILFLVPLSRSYSFKWRPDTDTTLLKNEDLRQQALDTKLRGLALRTFIGACLTLASSIANLTALTVLDGEPAWLCFLTCKSDILFSAVVIHWVTVTDSSTHSSATPTKPGSAGTITSAGDVRFLERSTSSRQGIHAMPISANLVHSMVVKCPSCAEEDDPGMKNLHSVDLGLGWS